MSETPQSATASFRAQPTLRIDGQQNDRIDRLMLEMTMREAEGGLSSLELAFVNWMNQADGQGGPAFEDEAVLKLGSEVKLYGGEVSGPTELFRGRVSALEYAFDDDGAPKLMVHAEDAAQKARLARRSEVYADKSLADVARAVAGRAGLTPVIDGLADATGTWVQMNESDLAFLRRLLARHAADVLVVADELHVLPRAASQRNQVELKLGSGGQLKRARIVADLAQQASEVRVTGFDLAQGAAVEGVGSGAALGPGSGRAGAALLQQVFGAREEQVSHRCVGSQAEARALAEAEFAARARGFVRLEGDTQGNPSVRVGTHVAISQVSARFDNTYVVTSATHRFDQRHGYRTTFCAESAYFGNPA